MGHKAYIGEKNRVFWQTVLQLEAAYLAERLSGCRDVLSIGCGTGLVEGLLLKRGFRMVGLDLAIDYLFMAPRELVKVHGQAESLPFASKQFDGVISVASMQFMDDQPAAIREACRVLRDGGRLVLMLLNPASPFVAERMADPHSYFSCMRRTALSFTADHAARYVDLEISFALGLRDGGLNITETDPGKALLCVLSGDRKTEIR